jgi:hypothetical protein
VMVANRGDASVWTLNQLLGLKKRRNGRTANKKTSEHREKELHQTARGSIFGWSALSPGPLRPISEANFPPEGKSDDE